ncbi:hypothetical protein ANCCEY_08143 [Ancylostoma ceylanicum]|uniref:Reverse transcriptase domain-containing protein n=1 Tax=Ancylostoma ceylanicum TaxID=53326 RepID=A0A0D6LL62_9BILA|nr:hypothetical protein ANCCEY_08143 [Ancylostoma ceylanicum]
MGVQVDGRRLNHLRFADDIVLIMPIINEAERMLADFDNVCGREVDMMNDFAPELGMRKRAAWGEYRSFEDVVKKTKNTKLRAHHFNTTVLPALTFYEMEAMATVSVWLQLLINKNVRALIVKELIGPKENHGKGTIPDANELKRRNLTAKWKVIPVREAHFKIWTKSLVFGSVLCLWGTFIVASLSVVIIYRDFPKLIRLENGILLMYFGPITMILEQRLFICAVASSFPFCIEVVRSTLESLSFENNAGLYAWLAEFGFYEMEAMATVSVWLQLLINKNVRTLIVKELIGPKENHGKGTTRLQTRLFPGQHQNIDI